MTRENVVWRINVLPILTTEISWCKLDTSVAGLSVNAKSNSFCHIRCSALQRQSCKQHRARMLLHTVRFFTSKFNNNSVSAYSNASVLICQSIKRLKFLAKFPFMIEINDVTTNTA